MMGTHLEGTEEEVEKELGEAQRALGMLISHKGEDHLVDPQQRDEGQRGPGEPAGPELEHLTCQGFWTRPQRHWPSTPALPVLGPGPCPPELEVCIAHLVGT